MSTSRPTPEQVLRRLEWTVLRRLDGLLHGDYRSLARGDGLELADLREYQYADDVRRIDWNVTARLQVPHVREYREERELAAWFLLDLSGSVEFGSQAQSKLDLATQFTALVARVLTRRGNRVGAILFGTEVEAVLAPRSGRAQVLHLLSRIERRPPTAAQPLTDLGALLASAGEVLRRRALAFVLSDFVSRPGWEQPLARLAQRHEVLAVRLVDPLERELPDLGLLRLRDAETGEQLEVDTGDPALRRRFAAAARARDEALQAALARAGVDALELVTGDDLAAAVLRFAELRRRRAQRSGAVAAGRRSRFAAAAEVRA